MKFGKEKDAPLPPVIGLKPELDREVLAVIRDYYGDPDWNGEVDNDFFREFNEDRRSVGTEIAKMKADALPATGEQRVCPKCGGKRLVREYTPEYVLGNSLALVRTPNGIRVHHARYRHYTEALTVRCSCGYELGVEQTADWPATRQVWTTWR